MDQVVRDPGCHARKPDGRRAALPLAGDVVDVVVVGIVTGRLERETVAPLDAHPTGAGVVDVATDNPVVRAVHDHPGLPGVPDRAGGNHVVASPRILRRNAADTLHGEALPDHILSASQRHDRFTQHRRLRWHLRSARQQDLFARESPIDDRAVLLP